MDGGGICIFTMMNPKHITINDYDYELPEGKIAAHPLVNRDASKLLVCKHGNIEETTFANIDVHIPTGSLLIFNNTKVINARIKFAKITGTIIEIFCLEPYGTITDYSSIMNKKDVVQWKCLVGGAAKWKEEILEKEFFIGAEKIILSAKKTEKITEAFIIEFTWQPNQFTFAEIIEAAGNVPLPPYIKRQTIEEDTSRYQTIFATHDGSVAAPTAGLHFTDTIFEKLQRKSIAKTFVTLHVGAGTFKPVKADTMAAHEMHAEYIDVDIKSIEEIKNNLGKIVVVGTTSLRTIETLFWLGIKVQHNKTLQDLNLLQWDVYDDKLSNTTTTTLEALESLLLWMAENNKQSIFTQTQILIAPGYTFRIANMLVTNFHQPRSTLLLLVAAAIGNDWKKMYDYALQNDFRFLSYGDGNLIFI
jgi:S-adenosylmethionine:tRNA ribosyltransferase-isomerase